MTPAACYVRVSSKEQVEGYSLDAQLHACHALCARDGYEIVDEYADAGLSAHTDQIAKRPAFARMLTDAEAGRFRVLVIHKLDRFARNVLMQFSCLERLAKAGVRVVSVSEPTLEAETPTGFLQLGIAGTINEWYSRNLSEETKKGWQGRKRAGLPAGRLPFGVMKGPDGIPAPDPATHPGLLLAFERAAEGATDSEVAAALNAAGYRPNPTARRAVFGRDAIRTILANRFYVGELPIGHRGKDGWLPARHEPIVPVDLFERVQRQRHERAVRSNAYHVPHARAVHALSGLVRCGACGEPMQQQGRYGRLLCRAQRDGRCRAVSVHEHIIEEELGLYLTRLRLPPDVQARVVEAYQRDQPQVAERANERSRIEGQLKRLADLYVLGDVAKAEYEGRRAELRAELARYVETAPHAQPEIVGQMVRYLTEIAQIWRDAGPARRNELARTVFEYVTVTDHHLVSVQPRAAFQPYFVLADTKSPAPVVEAGDCSMRRARGASDPQPRTLFAAVPVLV